MLTNRCLASVLSVALTAGLASCTDSGVGSGTVMDDSVPPPIITEFLAKNQAGLPDEDGETSDWIEVHNPHAVPIDLAGFHLTDRKSDAMRWTFPAGTTLQPGAYLVVFASGKDRATPGKPLHTNFKRSVPRMARIPRGSVTGAVGI